MTKEGRLSLAFFIIISIVAVYIIRRRMGLDDPAEEWVWLALSYLAYIFRQIDLIKLAYWPKIGFFADFII